MLDETTRHAYAITNTGEVIMFALAGPGLVPACSIDLEAGADPVAAPGLDRGRAGLWLLAAYVEREPGVYDLHPYDADAETSGGSGEPSPVDVDAVDHHMLVLAPEVGDQFCRPRGRSVLPTSRRSVSLSITRGGSEGASRGVGDSGSDGAGASFMRRLAVITGATTLRDDAARVTPAAGAVLLERLRGALGERAIEIDIPHDLLAPVGPVLFEHVFINLVENAVKYGAPPIEIAARSDDDHVELLVRDHGPSFPPNCEGRLFEKFFRAPGTRVPGIGLGLAVIRGIVEATAARSSQPPPRRAAPGLSSACPPPGLPSPRPWRTHDDRPASDPAPVGRGRRADPPSPLRDPRRPRIPPHRSRHPRRRRGHAHQGGQIGSSVQARRLRTKSTPSPSGRPGSTCATPPSPPKTPVHEVGSIRVHLSRHEVHVSGNQVHSPPSSSSAAPATPHRTHLMDQSSASRHFSAGHPLSKVVASVEQASSSRPWGENTN